MSLKQLLVRIRNMKDRKSLSQIISAAEARDSLLSNIEGKKTRKVMWGKVMKLGLAEGGMAFIHVGSGNGKHNGFHSTKHKILWGKALTVRKIKPRAKCIIVAAPVDRGRIVTTLSAFECAALKLSTIPTPEAFSNALSKDST